MKVRCEKCHAQHNVAPPPWVVAQARPFDLVCATCGHRQKVLPSTGIGLPERTDGWGELDAGTEVREAPSHEPAVAARAPVDEDLPEGDPFDADLEDSYRRATDDSDVTVVNEGMWKAAIGRPEPVNHALEAPPLLLRQQGQEFPCADLAMLQRWIIEHRVDPEDEISLDGGTWHRAGDRSDLQVFFAAVERLDYLEHDAVGPADVPARRNRKQEAPAAEDDGDESTVEALSPPTQEAVFPGISLDDASMHPAARPSAAAAPSDAAPAVSLNPPAVSGAPVPAEPVAAPSAGGRSGATFAQVWFGASFAVIAMAVVILLWWRQTEAQPRNLLVLPALEQKFPTAKPTPTAQPSPIERAGPPASSPARDIPASAAPPSTGMQAPSAPLEVSPTSGPPADPSAAALAASWLAMERGTPARAVELLRPMLASQPANPLVRYAMGTALHRLGRHEEAREHLCVARTGVNPVEQQAIASILTEQRQTCP